MCQQVSADTAMSYMWCLPKQGMLTEASAGRVAARAMEEAAAAGLERARMMAQEQELATLREALAFEEALRQQVCLLGKAISTCYTCTSFFLRPALLQLSVEIRNV